MSPPKGRVRLHVEKVLRDAGEPLTLDQIWYRSLHTVPYGQATRLTVEKRRRLRVRDGLDVDDPPLDRGDVYSPGARDIVRHTVHHMVTYGAAVKLPDGGYQLVSQDAPRNGTVAP